MPCDSGTPIHIIIIIRLSVSVRNIKIVHNLIHIDLIIKIHS